jgi:plasmid stability protein
MGQILVRQLDDAAIARLKARAKAQGTSVEALAREAIQRAAALSGTEKLELARQMRSEFQALMVPGAKQTPGWELIREGRDER